MSGKRSSWGMVAALALLAGCGGNTNHNGNGDGAAGSPAAGGSPGGGSPGGGSPEGGSPEGGGGRAAPPVKDGVPIGDCRELTVDERSPDCPAQPPQPLSSCDSPEDIVCAYDIIVEDRRASQEVFFCNGEPRTWGSGALVECGKTCGAPGAHVVELSGGSCSERAQSACDVGGTIYAFPTSQQRLDSAFQHLLRGCLGNAAFGNRFQLELRDGCPTSLSMLQAVTPEAEACIQDKLSGLRWECAVDLSCSEFSASYTTQ
jgi:hypothetical protein